MRVKGKELWSAAKGELQLQFPRATYETWIKDSRAESYEDGLLVVLVRNTYAKDWLQHRLRGVIERTLAGIAHRSVEVQFVVDQAMEEEDDGVELLSGLPDLKSRNHFNGSTGLNRSLTFGNFIVGSSNRLAQAAAVAVAESSEVVWNPLFIYGGVGLGKTHLLHAIGNKAAQSGRRVLYVSCEEFTNEFINAIREQKMAQFRARYREADLLLIDDVQFIGGKERTQEEFFHTFNTLYGTERLLAFSSDRPPKAIPLLEERLYNRFEWGLIADIQPPDLETRIAILRAKAEVYPVHVPDSVIETIAQRFQRNIRELEGALKRVVHYASTMRVGLTVKVAEEALRDILDNLAVVTPAMVLQAVSEHTGISTDDIKGPRRSSDIARARQMAMYLMKELAGASLSQIGRELGGRDHSTVDLLHDAETAQSAGSGSGEPAELRLPEKWPLITIHMAKFTRQARLMEPRLLCIMGSRYLAGRGPVYESHLGLSGNRGQGIR